MAISHLELFSGIGGFRYALEMLSKDFGINTRNIGFSELDSYAVKTYVSHFDATKEIQMGDIVAFASSEKNIKSLPAFNLLTGGFPCQSFSMMGKQDGFNDVRGNVFFQIISILKEQKPPFILLENVKNLISHNKGETLETITTSLINLGYSNVYYDLFNSKDFGLAQNRNRVYIFATSKKMPRDFKFTGLEIIKSFNDIQSRTTLERQNSIIDALDKIVDEKYYLSDIIKPTILSNGTKNFQSKSDINQSIARPLTATMAKMHRACQDNYYSDDFIHHPNHREWYLQKYTKEELAKKRIRRLTPKEAFKLQGFGDNFYLNAKRTGNSDSQLYKQAGNAVSVNTVYAILYHLIVKNKIMEL